MGTSFENIHIYTRKNSVPLEIEQANKVVRLAEDWLTLFPKEGHSFQDGYKEARKLSGILNWPVLWVSYFDDDMLNLTLLQKGKKACSYQMNDSGRIILEKPKTWKEVLKLTEQESAALRLVSKSEETAGGTLDLLSPVLGLPLYTFGILDGDAESEIYQKQPERVKNWLDQKKMLSRIKNRTRMKLCCELPGIYAGENEDWQYGIVRICPPDGQGSFTYSHICCYMIKEDVLVPVHSYHYPKELFRKGDKSLFLDYVHKDIMIMDEEAVGNGDGDRYWDAYIDILEGLITDNGRLKSHPLARKPEPANVIETPEGTYQYYCKSTDSHSPVVGKRRLDTLDGEEYRYESDQDQEWFWGYAGYAMYFFENRLVVVTKKICYGAAGKIINDVRFFDRDLKLLRQTEFITDKQQDAMDHNFVYIPERDTIFYRGCSCDLGSKKISRSDPRVDGEVCGRPDRKGNIVLLSGSAAVILLDLELHILSRHKLKGGIRHIYHNESGNLCFITVDEYVYEWSTPKADASVRIYELSYL